VKQIDEVSCLLRLHFQLATTLVHELVHALWNAVFGTALEPFYRDHRYAEVGWTYECLLAGGAISAIGHRVTSTWYRAKTTIRLSGKTSPRKPSACAVCVLSRSYEVATKTFHATFLG
jgi:hypothetical protein